MKVRIDKTYAMPAPADVTWALLHDIEAVAGCMPGAAITERVDDRHYKGTVAVRLGPANLSFRGEIEVLALDAATRSLQLAAKGTDSTGGSAASMTLTARVDGSDAASSSLVGSSEVSMSGKVAAFGNRMMGPVSEQVLAQFAANFAARVRSLHESRAAGSAGGSAPVASPTAAGEAQFGSAAGPPGAPAAAAPRNGLALIWAVLKGWLRALFAAKKA